MNENKLIEAMRDIDEKYILEAMPKEHGKEHRVHPAWRYLAIAACIALVLSAYPIYRMTNSKGNVPSTVVVTYSSIEEMEAALGFDTVLSSQKQGIWYVQVLYASDDGVTPDLSRPIQMATRTLLRGSGFESVISYNILFGVNDVNKLNLPEYGILDKTENIGETMIYYSSIDMGEYTSNFAAFTDGGNLYTLEANLFKPGDIGGAETDMLWSNLF